MIVKMKTNSNISKDEINVVYSFIGNLPLYLIDVVHQTRLFFDGKIYVIVNDYLNPLIHELQLKYNIIIIRYNDVVHNIFNEIVDIARSKFPIVNGLIGRERLFICAFERFFILHNLMVQNKLKNIFFSEIDNLIYDNPIKWIDGFQSSSMSFMFDGFERCSSGVCYIKDQSILESFLCQCIRYILTTTKYMTEMNALAEFQMKNLVSVHLLPTHWKDVTKPKLSYEFFGMYGDSIFDAAAIGIFLGGLDPFHTKGVIIPGAKSPNSSIDFTKYQYEWKIDESDRLIPYIWTGSMWLRINNLHIHSKNLSIFLSKKRD